MTAPARIGTTPRPTVSGHSAASGVSAPFGGSTPPDHRTTALQSAVAVLRGGKPAPATEDVLNMAEAFYQFLKAK